MHPEPVREQADKAREFVLANRTIEQSIGTWRDAVNNIS
jgi:hypothetical protein